MTEIDPRRLRTARDAAGELGDRPNVAAVLLHGSTVRGEASEGSDLDLLVVTTDEEDASWSGAPSSMVGRMASL